MPSAAEVITAYRKQAEENRGQISWFIALGALKLAAIQAHNRRRHLDGRFHDPYQALLGPACCSSANISCIFGDTPTRSPSEPL